MACLKSEHLQSRESRSRRSYKVTDHCLRHGARGREMSGTIRLVRRLHPLASPPVQKMTASAVVSSPSHDQLAIFFLEQSAHLARRDHRSTQDRSRHEIPQARRHLQIHGLANNQQHLYLLVVHYSAPSWHTQFPCAATLVSAQAQMYPDVHLPRMTYHAWNCAVQHHLAAARLHLSAKAHTLSQIQSRRVETRFQHCHCYLVASRD
mmetsp:Transcript_12606/g.20840  ORF Transcript_12606/g.20840 Transcript_12606/m.20840 type:complete len:207 (+) Transcript_12606:47-667(+)